MQKIDQRILRIIDANINRVKEALRVCEDSCRFGLDYPKITAQFKQLRHQVTAALKILCINAKELLEKRNILADVGKKTIKPELRRQNFQEVFLANLQRAKESIRVLEEFSKIYNLKAAQYFKNIRYRAYQLEKEIMQRFSARRH